MELSAVYRDAARQNAKIYPWNIGFADAATIELQQQYAIFIDCARCESASDYAWKLGHEVSHCATGSTHAVCSPYDLVEKHEYTAKRREIETYLPAESIRAALRAGYTAPWELAEYLGVPQYAIEQALQYWTVCRGETF